MTTTTRRGFFGMLMALVVVPLPVTASPQPEYVRWFTERGYVFDGYVLRHPPQYLGKISSIENHDILISSGELTANPTEIEEGYFGIAQQTMVMVAKDSPGHLHLRELANHSKVQLIARVLP